MKIRSETFLQISPLVAINFSEIVLDETCTILVLPLIQEDLDISQSLAQWISSVYYIFNSAFSVPLCRIGDTLGYMKVYRTLCVLSLLFNVLIGFSQRFYQVLLIRIIEGTINSGISSNFNIIKMNLLIAEIATAETQKGVVLSNLLSIIIPIFGSLLAEYCGWKVLYYICAGISCINFCCSFLITNFTRNDLLILDGLESERQERFDTVGSVIFILFMCSFCVAFTLLSFALYYWFAGALCCSLVSVILLVVYERKEANPILPAFIAQEPLLGLLILYMLLYLQTTACNWMLPQLLSDSHCQSSLAGYITAAEAFVCTLTSLVCPEISKTLTLRTLILISYAFLCCVLVAEILSVSNYVIYSSAYVTSFLFFAVQMQNLYVLLMRSVPQSCTSMIAGLPTCSRTFGQALSLSYFTMIFEISSSYQLVIGLVLPFSVLGTIVSYYFLNNSAEERHKMCYHSRYNKTVKL